MRPEDWFSKLGASEQVAPLLLVGDSTVSEIWINKLWLLLFCENKNKPCLKCKNCRLVSKNEHPDIHNIQPQGASRQIPRDLVLQIQGWINQKVYTGPWCVVWIEEADRLNKVSANTILKALEEPPPMVLFILSTSMPESMLPTILSRCQKVILHSEGLNVEQKTKMLWENIFSLMGKNPVEAFLWVQQVLKWLEERQTFWDDSIHIQNKSEDFKKAFVSGKMMQEVENGMGQIYQQAIEKIHKDHISLEWLDMIESALEQLKTHINERCVLEYLALSVINQKGPK